MAYNHNISMAHITNIVEALTLYRCSPTCDDLMQLIWRDASTDQRARKINAFRDENLRTPSSARKQVRQEIRRTLYNYFNNVDESLYTIYRATSPGNPERFLVLYPLDSVDMIEEPLDEMSFIRPFE